MEATNGKVGQLQGIEIRDLWIMWYDKGRQVYLLLLAGNILQVSVLQLASWDFMLEGVMTFSHKKLHNALMGELWNWDVNALKLHEKTKTLTIPSSNETAPKLIIFKVCILSDLYHQSQSSKI